jgi:hypothetical protein
MIISTIGRHKSIVQTMADAESLLEIFERATPIADFIDFIAENLNTRKTGIYKTTRGKGGGTYYRPDSLVDIGIEITNRELVSEEEHNGRQLKRRERRIAEEAAEARVAAASVCTGMVGNGEVSV